VIERLNACELVALIFVILVSRGSTPPGLSTSLDSLDMTVDVLRSSVGCIK
jgi:hypothetical protein